MIKKHLKLLLILLPSTISSTLYAQQNSYNEIAGILTIHSDVNGQTSSSLINNTRGHSWLSFESNNGNTFWTVGTWDKGIKVGQRISTLGVNKNLEINRHPSAYRRTPITVEEYDKLNLAIKQYSNWTLIKNCSYFASHVWKKVTGETLENWSPTQDQELRELVTGNDFGISRTIPFPSPSGLYESIFVLNDNRYNNDKNIFRHRYELAKQTY